MRQSRRKITVDDIPLVSITQKLREKPSKLHFRRECCEKENHSRKQSSDSRGKQHTSSAKKSSSKKKKYFEDEVEKMLQKRSRNELNEVRVNNAHELQGLRGDMQAMKDVIAKLSLEEWNSRLLEKSARGQDARRQYQVMNQDNLKKIEQLKEALAVQRQINSKLEEAHIQSQLFAKQTKDYSETINRELGQLAAKHMECENNAKALAQSIVQINQLTKQLASSQHEKQRLQDQARQINDAYSKVFTENTALEKELEQSQNMVNSMKEENTTLFNENRELADTKSTLSYELLSKDQQIKRLYTELNGLQKELSESQQKLNKQTQVITGLEEQISHLRQERMRAQQQIQRLQSDFENTKNDLGSKEMKLKGLISMERKCEQLYQAIKNQKKRWDRFNSQSTQEKQKLEKQLESFKNKEEQLLAQLQTFKTQKEQAVNSVQQLKAANQKANSDKAKLEKQIRELQDKINTIQEEIEEIEQQKIDLEMDLSRCQKELEEKQVLWCSQRATFQSKIEWLQKQKSQIEHEVRGTLEVAKKRNDQIQAINHELKNEVISLKEQKKKLDSNFKKLSSQFATVSSQNERFKAAIGSKESKIIQLEFKINQLHEDLEAQVVKARQLERDEEAANLQWVAKYESISKKLDKCLEDLKQSKMINANLESELTSRDEKITNLSTIREDLEQRLSNTESQLHDSQTARLSLSSEVEDYQLLTKRNEENQKEDKIMYENELSKKNKIIQELKETIKLIKEESFKIQEEMIQLRKLEEFEELAAKQMEYIQNALRTLTQHKDELSKQIACLKLENQTLTNKVQEMERIGASWTLAQTSYSKDIEHTQQQKQLLEGSLAQQKEKIKQLSEELRSVKQSSEFQKKQLEQRLDNTIRSLNELRATLNESHENTSKLIRSSTEKDARIEQLSEKLSIFEEKKRKVVNEVHSIQNQISEYGMKNNMLQETNRQLQAELKGKEDKIKGQIQKNKLLIEANRTLEAQVIALSEQIKILKDQLNEAREASRAKQQQSHRSMNEVYEICEARKSEAVGQIKQKVQQLANQLSNCITKLNCKNQQLQACQKKCANLKQVLQENHVLLTEEKSKNERTSQTILELNHQIDACKCQINAKEREIETLNRDKTILREKIVEQDSKYEILKRKFEHLQAEKVQSEREIENQSISLRVLREENRNIEKVMSEQINQRKVIIEQLVHEKKMLYSQLHHQR